MPTPASTPGHLMPAVFFGHGSPMNTLERNRYTEAWRRAGAQIPRPEAILAVSAHWVTAGTALTAMDRPQTLHDFYGFPQTLFQFEYPAPGAPGLAARVRELLSTPGAELDYAWGLDHGTWSVLAHAYPQAEVPVIQLSLNATYTLEQHYAVARMLAPLRDEGVLVIGSGNVVHNLRLMRPQAGAYDWAVRFNERIKAALAAGDHVALLDLARAGSDAQLAVPTLEHYLPLIYVAGLAHAGEKLNFLVDGYESGSLGMLSFAFGMQNAD